MNNDLNEKTINAMVTLSATIIGAMAVVGAIYTIFLVLFLI